MGKRTKEDIEPAVRNFSARRVPYSRLPGYETLKVVYGNRIFLPEARFEWRGAGQWLYLCWAPKPKVWVTFDHGANIPGGLWGWAKFWAPDATTFQWVDLSFTTAITSLQVEIKADVHTDPGYHSWIWMCDDRQGKAFTNPDTDFLVIDDDANVFDIIIEADIKNLNVGYAVV